MNEWEWHLLEDKPALENLEIEGIQVKPGDHVKLRPRAGGDVFDLALTGRIATVESIEQDYEGHVHLSVVVDDDPGRDIGMMRQPGHRFFFSVEEVEPLEQNNEKGSSNEKTSPTILVAGIGNIFLGDDAFGVEVVKRFEGRDLPAGVRIVDFGIRGLDLTYSLIDGADVVVLVDACPRGGSPGDLYVMEPDLSLGHEVADRPATVDAHSMDPMTVIRAAQAMGGTLKKILLLGCEPHTFGLEEGYMGLSEPVAAAVDRAVPLLESLMKRILDGG